MPSPLFTARTPLANPSSPFHPSIPQRNRSCMQVSSFRLYDLFTRSAGNQQRQHTFTPRLTHSAPVTSSMFSPYFSVLLLIKYDLNIYLNDLDAISSGASRPDRCYRGGLQESGDPPGGELDPAPQGRMDARIVSFLNIFLSKMCRRNH